MFSSVDRMGHSAGRGSLIPLRLSFGFVPVDVFSCVEGVDRLAAVETRKALQRLLRRRKITSLRWADVKNLPTLEVPQHRSRQRKLARGAWPGSRLPAWGVQMLELAQRLVTLWRAAFSPAPEFIDVCRTLKDLWLEHFPADDPRCFRYAISTHVVLDHLWQYVAHWGSEIASVIGSEEAGEKAHQYIKRLWRESMQLCRGNDGELLGSRCVLLRPLRDRMFSLRGTRIENDEDESSSSEAEDAGSDSDA